ncbi:MAG: MFS transporter [Erysipelotrichaceae bacterium]|nr:MFS transporter [Erysipelotrichaceae bacterium]
MNKRPVSPWWILAACCGLSSASIGITINTSGVFYTAVCDDLGLLRGNFAMHATLLLAANAVFSLVVPKLYEKFKPMLVLRICVLSGCALTALMAWGSSELYFNIIGILRGITTCCFSFILLTMVLNAWFHAKNGLATSICFSFAGLTGALLSPVLSFCISSFGWRMTYLIDAAIMLAACLPAILLPFAITPAELDSRPLMDSAQPAAQALNASQQKSASKISAVCMISLCIYSLAVCCLTSYTQHFPGYVEHLGYSTAVGAGLLSAAMVGNVLTKLTIGAIADRVGKIKAVLVMVAAMTAGLALVVYGSGAVILTAGSFLFGACYSVGAVGIVLLTQQFFGLQNYNRVYPTVMMAGNLGAAGSLTVIGWIYDLAGSYTGAFVLAFALTAISALCIWICIKTSWELKTDEEKARVLSKTA